MLKGYESQVNSIAQTKGSPTQSQEIRVPQTAQYYQQGMQAAAQDMNKLSNRLKQFADTTYGIAVAQIKDQAKRDALEAAKNGEPFHRKSVWTAYGSVYNETASATYAANAEINISKKSDEYAIQFENDPSGYNNAMEEYVSSLKENAPTAELQSVIDISGTKTRNAVFGKLKIAEKKRQDESEMYTFTESFSNDLSKVVQLRVDGGAKNEADATMIIFKNESHLKALQKKGSISEIEANKLRDEAEFQLVHNVAIGKMRKLVEKGDLEAAKELLDAETSEYNQHMSVEENEKHRSDLISEYSMGLKKLKSESKSNAKNANKYIRAETKILDNLGTPTDITTLKQALSEADDEFLIKEFNDKLNTVQYFKSLRDGGLSLQEIQNHVDGLEVGTQEEVTRKELMQKFVKSKITKANDDIVRLAIEENVIQYDTPMNVNAGVPSLIEGLYGMTKKTELIKSNYGSQYTNLMSNADAKEWNDWFNNRNTSISDKLYLISEIAENFPEESSSIFHQIGGKGSGMLTFAATLSTDGNAAAASIALMGSQSDVELEEGYGTDVSSYIGNAFSGYEDKTVYNNIKNGVISYAKGAITQKEGGAVDAAAAVEATIGEIVGINGQNVVLPRGVSKSSFEDKLDNISIPGRPNLEKGIRDMSNFWRSSGDYQLRYAGQGEYNVYIRGRGYVKDEKGKAPFVLKWGEF